MPEKKTPPNQAELDEEEDPEFSYLLEAFADLGFDHWTAFALAWRGFSPSDTREGFLKRGATHEWVAKYLLT